MTILYVYVQLTLSTNMLEKLVRAFVLREKQVARTEQCMNRSSVDDRRANMQRYSIAMDVYELIVRTVPGYQHFEY